MLGLLMEGLRTARRAGLSQEHPLRVEGGVGLLSEPGSEVDLALRINSQNRQETVWNLNRKTGVILPVIRN